MTRCRVTLGFIIAVVLAAVAYYQYTLSEERRKIATSRQLAAQATNRLDEQLDLALLLSVEAYRTRNTIEARRTLFNAVQHNPRLTTFLHGHTAGVLRIAFSPNAATLASGGWDTTIRVWDVAARQPIGSAYTGHTNYVRSVAFSPDGRILASANSDGTISLFDVATRQPIGRLLTGYTFNINTLSFDSSGSWLASAGGDISPGRARNDSSKPQNGTIMLWDVSIVSWVNRACRRANRNFSPDKEWARFLEYEPYRRTCLEQDTSNEFFPINQTPSQFSRPPIPCLPDQVLA